MMRGSLSEWRAPGTALASTEEEAGGMGGVSRSAHEKPVRGLRGYLCRRVTRVDGRRALRRGGRAIGVHDPARGRPARRGADAAGRGAGGRRRVALPRLLVQLRAWAAGRARRAVEGVRAVAAVLARA